ncbi:fimbrial protein [Pseudomonas sp. URMO17WK12:I12]|jgi:major type 1 subunit fimbrin (pilin)|uniref:fimbrial protein n=2 Tax=Bacteria TaxID=2 RepID=UPI000484A382|nr:fimbrial protein [Pseudomonas sp. URMO17WK12:I12]
MSKFPVVSLCALLGVLGFSSVQAASDGVINFDGEIIAGGCDVAPGSDAQTVNMGIMSVKSFKGAGSTVGSAQFNIELANCHPSLTSVGLVFDGISSADDDAILALQGANSAQGVGIALYEIDGTTLIPLRMQGRANILNGESGTTLRYVAKYKATSETVTAGKASAVVNFTLVYN